MAYIILSDLQVVLFFVFLIIENFEKIFIYYLIIRCIIIYHTIIIPNILDKMVNYMEFGVVKG